MPNPLVVRLADKLLDRDGALIAAVQAHAGIQSRLPDWIEGKLRGMMHFHEGISPEKVLQWPPHFTEEDKQRIINAAYAKPWRLTP